MSIRINPTGDRCYVPDDRSELIATGGVGNGRPGDEIHLEFLDGATGLETILGWFSIEELELLIDQAKTYYKMGTTF